jgi:hypothetical protein
MNNSGPLTVARSGAGWASTIGIRAQIVDLLEARLTRLKGRPRKAAPS